MKVNSVIFLKGALLVRLKGALIVILLPKSVECFEYSKSRIIGAPKFHSWQFAPIIRQSQLTDFY